MADGDEYSLEGQDVDPDGLLDVQTTITGRPAEDLSSDPIVKVRERRWLNRFKKIVQKVTKRQRVATGNVRHARDDGLCWDEVESRDDVLTYDERQTWQKYEDWEFEVRFNDYLRWVNSQLGIRVETPPGGRIPPDGVLPWPRMTIRDLEGRDFVPPEKQRRVDSGWANIEGERVGEPQLVEQGVPYWVTTEKHPCPEVPATTGEGTTETAQFKAIDIDTGQPIGGALVFKGVGGLAETPKAISDASWGYALLGHLGGKYTIVYEPPAGYQVVGNSEQQTPSDAMQVSLDKHTEAIRQFVFFARKVKAPAATGTPVPGPVAPAPKGEQPQPATGPDDGLPPPPDPRRRRRLRIKRISPAVGISFAIGIGVIAVGVYAITTSGGDTPPSRDGGTGAGGSPFYIPSVLEPSSLVADLPVVSVPSTVTTDPDALGVEGDVLDAYLDNGLLLDQTGFLFHEGLDPGAEDSWPDGVEGSFNWKVSYLQTRQGALAVQQARQAGLDESGFRSLELPPALAGQGISAFEPATPPDTGLVNQIWYWTRGNAFFAIAGTGKFPPGSRRPDQETLYDTLGSLVREEPLIEGAPFTETQAGGAYSDAIAPVNDAAPGFRAKAQRWDASTTTAQAEADARPLAAALDGIESEVLTIAGRYAPARPELRTVIAAVEVVKADLSDLTRLDTIGVKDWISRYDADIDALTTASNTVRAALGLPVADS